MSSALVELMEQALGAPKRMQKEVALAGQAVLQGNVAQLLARQAQAARMLACSRFTIRRLEKDGKLHPVFIRGLKRYRVEEVRALTE